MENLKEKPYPHFTEIIDNCFLNLKKEGIQKEDKERLSGIIIQRVINNIRLGTEDISVRLGALDKVFENRSFLEYENAEKQIKGAYESLVERVEDINIKNIINDKIQVLDNCQ